MPETTYSGWGSVATIAAIVLALIGPGIATQADPTSFAIIHDIHVRAQASASPVSSPDIVGLAPSLPLPEPAPVVVAPSPVESQPAGGTGGGGGGGGGAPPPPACKPSIPGSISASPGSITRNAYDGNSGSWTVSEVGQPGGTPVTISISGMVGCGGGLHHTLRATVVEYPSNHGCSPTMGSSATIPASGFTFTTYSADNHIDVSVRYDSGCP